MSKKIERVVAVAGFANGDEQMRHIAERLSSPDYLNLSRDPEVFKLRSVLDDTNVLERASEGAIFVGHSGGFIRARNATQALGYIGIAPSEPINYGEQIWGATKKFLGDGAELLTRDKEQRTRVANIMVANTVEYLRTIPKFPQIMGEITTFSAVQDAVLLKSARPDATISLRYFDKDEFGFAPEANGEASARALGIDVETISGRHDEIYYDESESVLKTLNLDQF